MKEFVQMLKKYLQSNICSLEENLEKGRGQMNQLLEYRHQLIACIVFLASLPSDPFLWAFFTSLFYLGLSYSLSSKSSRLQGIYFGIFYGITGVFSYFLSSDKLGPQKQLFSLLIAKYTCASPLTPWVSFASQGLLLYMAGDHSNFNGSQTNAMLSSLWFPLLLLLALEPLTKTDSYEEPKTQDGPRDKTKIDDLTAEVKNLKAKLASLEDFIATSFHELKNPLNIVLGNLTLMASQSSPQNELLPHLKKAVAAGEYLRLMITSTLDWSKNNFQSVEVCLKEVDTLAFLQKVWTICGSLINNKSLRGFLRASKDLPSRISVDEQRFMQIIINFITNAVKFTRDGFVSLEFDWAPATSLQLRKTDRSAKVSNESISEKNGGENICVYSSSKCRFLSNKVNYFELNNLKEIWGSKEKLSTTDAKGFLKIKIIDSGCGMNQSQIDSLFQKFKQVHSDEGINQMGTGLGLWISKQLIDKLKGSVKADSHPSVGTTFEILIPVETRTPSVSTDLSISDSKGALQGRFSQTQNSLSLVSGQKVLIVDDDKFNVAILKEWCQKQGFRTLEACNGKEAVALVKSRAEEIGVILMDEEMPELKGTQAITQINVFTESMGFARIQSFCLSGNSSTDFTHECLRAGFDEVITKPINFETLKASLIRVLSKQIRRPFNST